MKASKLIEKLQTFCAIAGKDVEVYHRSGYDPFATKDFTVGLQQAGEWSNLVTHYGATAGEDYIVLDVAKK
jgi:hypothetical protein